MSTAGGGDRRWGHSLAARGVHEADLPRRPRPPRHRPARTDSHRVTGPRRATPESSGGYRRVRGGLQGCPVGPPEGSLGVSRLKWPRGRDPALPRGRHPRRVPRRARRPWRRTCQRLRRRGRGPPSAAHQRAVGAFDAYVQAGELEEPRRRSSTPFGNVCPGVTHQALELLTDRFDVGHVNRVRLPAPAAAVGSGQVDGPAGREDGGAPRHHLVEAGPVRSPSTSTAPRRAPRNAERRISPPPAVGPLGDEAASHQRIAAAGMPSACGCPEPPPGRPPRRRPPRTVLTLQGMSDAQTPHRADSRGRPFRGSSR